MKTPTAVETEKCKGCGDDLEVKRTFSVVHGKEFRFVSDCKRCEAAQAAAAEAFRLAMLVPKLIRKAEVPERWQAASLDPAIWPALVIDAGNLAAVETLRAWVMGDESLYVYGSTGGGKTTLAIAALMDTCRLGIEGLFISEMDLEADLHRGWQRDLIYRSWEVPVLVLDDIGSREMEPRLLTVYRDIFDRRSMNGMKTLVTGQLVPKASKGEDRSLMNLWKAEAKGGKVREDIASRLRQILDGHSVELTGTNRRLGVRK